MRKNSSGKPAAATHGGQSQLRIIAGQWRSRQVDFPMAHALRPTPKSRTIAVISAEGASARRGPRWPDVLGDWADIYEERLFPSSLMPVAGEILSEQGGDCLTICVLGKTSAECFNISTPSGFSPCGQDENGECCDLYATSVGARATTNKHRNVLNQP